MLESIRIRTVVPGKHLHNLPNVCLDEGCLSKKLIPCKFSRCKKSVQGVAKHSVCTSSSFASFSSFSLSVHPASFMWLKCLVQLRPDQTRPDQTRRAAFFALLLPQSLNYLVFQLFVVGFGVLPLPLTNSLLSFIFVWQGTVL